MKGATMKAIAVLPGKREVQLRDHQMPKITSPTHVKLRMLEVGVCGTDREICAFEYGSPPDGNDYLVIGHESLGEVVEVGPEVKRLQAGDLVVPMVRRPCSHDHCLACKIERQDFCYTGDFTERGIKQAHGYMTEFVVDDERYMHVVPRELREVAVLVEPLTIAEKALDGAEAMIALHVFPDIPIGQISIKDGQFLAACDSFDIKIRGSQAHGAYPTPWASAQVMNVVRKELPPSVWPNSVAMTGTTAATGAISEFQQVEVRQRCAG